MKKFECFVKISFEIKILTIFLTVFLFSAGNCNPPPPPPPPFEINIENISNPTPNLNDIYTIRWSYSLENRFEDHFVELQSLTFDGNLSRRFFGCPPPEFRPPELLGEPNDCTPEIQTAACPDNTTVFTNQCRFFRDTFTGPVIFSITAKDAQTGSWKRKSVTLKIPNSHFRTGLIQQSNQGYPQISGFATEVKQLEFLKYFAIYNRNGRDNVSIEDLNAPPFSALFAAERPFFGTSTRVEEALGFGFTLGRNFPILDPGFIETAEGQRYFGQRTHAEAVVFAGTIHLEGQVETKTIKTDTGEATITIVTQLPVSVTPQGGNTTSFFPSSALFIQIDLADSMLNTPPALEPMTVSNVRFGNRGQGLVMPTFGGEITPVVPTITQGQITLLRAVNNNPVGITNGDIPSAGVAFQLTRINGELLLPASVQITDISWRNVPAFADDSLETLLNQN